MELFDTHTHLYLEEFAPEEAEAVRRAIDAGVSRMMMPNVDLSTIEPMKRLAAQFPANVWMAMGLHPTEINADWEEPLAKVEHELRSNPGLYRAVGEVGIDLYWDKTYREEQMQAFERQLGRAAELSLPVIIHCREGLAETLEVIDGLEKQPMCIFHSFGGSADDVESIRRRGDHYFGINGIVTFKNSRLRDTLPSIGLDRILLETDSPYLSPVPFRGKRNESAYLVNTARCVAEALGKSEEEVARTTTASANKVFQLS